MQNTLRKIRSIDELAVTVEELKASGKVVVQAHGTFDLLHLGHFRHLQAARRNGDVLIVTVTADKFVNKGPGRPVFKEDLRAEMLASLVYVDWIAINHAPDSIGALKAIKPDIYVKGQDYQNPEGDVTGRISAEREAVEAHGGSIVFTEEITYSSSELINRHMNVFEPHVRGHLNELRENGGLDGILSLIDKLKDMRVLLVGDAIIDEYDYVVTIGKPPKEDLIATRFVETELFAGGVFAAANHVASFCKHVEAVSVLGMRDSYEDMIRQSLKPNVTLKTFYRAGAPTTRKRRFVDPSYMRKLFEVYYMDDQPLTEDISSALDQFIRDRAGEFDLVIVTDFGHGMIGRSTIDALTTHARFLAVNAQSNSANMGFNLISRYPRADYICIDGPEARLAARDNRSPMVDVITEKLPQLVQCSKVIITQGKYGCITYEEGGITHTIPSLADTVIDTVGAGDAFLAVTAPMVAAGGAMHEIGFIGNVVGAIKVGIVGHRESVEKATLIKAVTALLK